MTLMDRVSGYQEATIYPELDGAGTRMANIVRFPKVGLPDARQVYCQYEDGLEQFLFVCCLYSSTAIWVRNLTVFEVR